MYCINCGKPILENEKFCNNCGTKTLSGIQFSTNHIENNFANSITDRDGNIYHAFKIAAQIWTVENLKVSHFSNGEIIPEIQSDKEWEEAGKNKKPAWCFYNNDSKNGKLYGKLYNWYAVIDSRGLAPKGWHIPTDAEWTTFTDNIGGQGRAGLKMMEPSSKYWKTLDIGADNSSGFTATPSGIRASNGIFSDIGCEGRWWTTTEFVAEDAFDRSLDFNYMGSRSNWYWGQDSYSPKLVRFTPFKSAGLSVRCIKDY